MANGTFGGGAGSPENPYIVEDAQDLNAVRNSLSASYLQNQDIDLSFYANWLPIGAPFSSFTGVYDGGGYSILNVYSAPSIDDSNCVGLFNETFNSLIKNVHLYGIFSGPNHYSVGGIAGAAYFNQSSETSFSVFENCYVEITILNSYEDAGGIIGSGNGALIYYSSSKSTVNSDYAAGGIAGTLKFGSIENCYSISSLSGVSVGGIVGYTGGILGAGKTLPWLYPPTISFCYSASTISGSTIDGIIGAAYPVSYGSSAPWTEQPTTCIDSYFDSTISGISVSDYGTPKTTQEMKNKGTYIDWEFYIDFYTEGIWDINQNINNGYPYLIKSFRYLFGNGSLSSPYQIWNYEDLYSVRYYPSNFFIQMADINMSGAESWKPINTENIDYNGNNKSIKNMTILADDQIRGDLGLFGYIEYIADIYNLKIINATIYGNDNSWGGFGFIIGGGYSYSHDEKSINISNCITVGNIFVYSDYNIGGIAGYIDGGTINNCYSRIDIKIFEYASVVGGIVGGLYWGEIINCKTDGKIIHENYIDDYSYRIGGICGDATAIKIEGCSSSCEIKGSDTIGGIVGMVDDSYWQQEHNNIIKNCYSNGIISSYYGWTGGIVGTDISRKTVFIEKNYFSGKILCGEEWWERTHEILGSARSLTPSNILLENDKVYVLGSDVSKILEMNLNFEIIREVTLDKEVLSGKAIINDGFIYIMSPLRKIRISDLTIVARSNNDQFGYQGERNIIVIGGFLYISFQKSLTGGIRHIMLYKIDINTLEIVQENIIKIFTSGSYDVRRVISSDNRIYVLVYKSYDTHYILAVDIETMTVTAEATVNNYYDGAASYVDICQDENYIYVAPVHTASIRRYTKDLSSYVQTGYFPDTIRYILTDGSYLYAFARNGSSAQKLYKISIPSLTLLENQPNTTNGRNGHTYYNGYIYTIINTYDIVLQKMNVNGFSSFSASHEIYKDYDSNNFYSEKCISNFLLNAEDELNVGVGKSVEELRNLLTYNNWNFNTIWDINENKNNGFPFLRNTWQISPFPDGSITRTAIDELYLYNIKTSFINQGVRSYLSRIEKRDLSTLELLDASDFLEVLVNGPVVVDDNFLYLPATSYHSVGWGFFHSNTNFIKVEKNSLKVVEKTEDMFSSSASSTDIQDLIVNKDYLITTAVPSNSYNELHSFNKYNLYPHKVRNPSLFQKENNLSLSNDTIYALNTTGSIKSLNVNTMEEITSVLLNSTKYKAAIKDESIFLTSLGEDGAILEKRSKNSPTMELIESLDLTGGEYPSHLLINEQRNTEYLNDRNYLFCSGDGELYNKIIKIDSETNTFVTTSEPIDSNPSDIKSICTDGLFLFILNENDNLIKINCKTMEITETISLEKDTGEILNKLLYGEKFLYLISEHSAKWKVRKIDPETGTFVLSPSIPGAGKPFKTVTYNRGNILGIDSDNILYRIRTSNMLFDSAAPISSTNDSILLEAANEYLYSIDTNQEARSIQEFNWTVNQIIPTPFTVSETAKIYTDKHHIYITPGNNGEIYWLRAHNGLLDPLYKEENLDYNVDILTGDTNFIYLSATNESGTINKLLEYRREDISLNKEINIENSKITHCISLNLAIG